LMMRSNDFQLGNDSKHHDKFAYIIYLNFAQLSGPFTHSTGHG